MTGKLPSSLTSRSHGFAHLCNQIYHSGVAFEVLDLQNRKCSNDESSKPIRDYNMTLCKQGWACLLPSSAVLAPRSRHPPRCWGIWICGALWTMLKQTMFSARHEIKHRYVPIRVRMHSLDLGVCEFRCTRRSPCLASRLVVARPPPRDTRENQRLNRTQSCRYSSVQSARFSNMWCIIIVT